jgi:choline transporter-like protein 2/4/5
MESCLLKFFECRERCLKAHIIMHYPFNDDTCIGAGCYFTFMRYDELRRAQESANADPVTDGPGRSLQSSVFEPLEHQWDQLLAMKDTWLAFLIISAVTLAIVLLLVIFLRNRIRIAVALIKEASK